MKEVIDERPNHKTVRGTLPRDGQTDHDEAD